MIGRIDHVGVVAPSWETARSLLVDTFGWALDESCLPDGIEYEPEDTRLYSLKTEQGETRVEVLIPRDSRSGIGRFLAKRGPGLHHIAYACEDLSRETERLRARGLEPIPIGDLREGVFFPPRDTMGILIELVPRPRRAV
jgi:methylmalonyl-CoA/ethylmalonyl-CoA epimerase